ncbi:MAG: UvrD-helicase domain-containing protein [Bacillota bacterium]
MIEIKNQQLAIFSKSDNILLSASAGTGKTHTMVARIVELLKNGANISEFLVLAFGNDASKEMHERIENGIISLAKTDKKYLAQLKKLKIASVSTIHAFALEIAKTYFAVCGCSPKAKVLLGADEDVLKSAVMDKVFLDCYEKAEPWFLSLVEYFIRSRKDDGLKEHIFKLYSFGRNMPSGEFEKCFIETLENKKLENLYLEITKSKAKSYLEKISDTPDHEIYQKQKDQSGEILRAIASATTLKEIRDYCGVKFHAKSRMKKAYPENYANINENFHTLVQLPIKDFIKDTCDELFCLEESESFICEYREIAKKLFALTALFESEYQAEKSKKDFVDFSDTEHMLLAVLKDEKSREELQARYQYVFCDEYQDVSKIQEEILSLLSQKGNLFVVGDIKQGIYGFRACDQTVIKNRELDILANGNGELLPMNTNFRSHADILEFTNSVFSVAMNNPHICEYEKTSMFEAMANFPDMGGVEIAIAKKKKNPPVARLEVYSVLADKGGKREEINAESEGIHIAKFVKKYLGKQFDFPSGTRDVRLSDFAILLRSASGKFAPTLARVLGEYNLPSYIASSETTLESHTKVLFLHDFLKTVASPLEDVSLYSTLVSPFFQISDNTLLEIRKSFKAKYFHQSFFGFAKDIAKKYNLGRYPFAVGAEEKIATTVTTETTATTETTVADKKAMPFEDAISSLKETLEIQQITNANQSGSKSESEPDIFGVDFSPLLENADATDCEKAVARFLTAHKKYRTIACYSVGDMLKGAIAENSVFEKINLAFGESELDFACKFVDFVATMQSESVASICTKVEKAFTTLKLPGSQTSTNAICIMTMHKSKGLEFPFTIIANAGKAYNLKDASAEILFHKDYGIAFAKRDIEIRKKIDTIQKIALKTVLVRETKNEELRLLYVALTRAKFKLLITGTIDGDFFVEDNIAISSKIPNLSCKEDFYKCNSHLEIILASLAKTKYKCNYSIVSLEEIEEVENIQTREYHSNGELCENFALKMKNFARANYPIIPTKFTATQRLESFSKKVEEENLQVLEKYEVSKIIDFQTKKSIAKTAENNGYSKAEIGTAYHKILETVPFYSSLNQIEKFTADLVASGEILDIEYDFERIYRLTNNPIFGGVNPHREVPFVMQMPSEMFNLAPGDNLLCQGIIDCVFQNQDGTLTLVDYKATSIKNHQILQDKYFKQLETYKIACEKILSCKVAKCYIYSIFFEELIEIDC